MIPALLMQRPEDDWFQRLLGFVVLFFVVVWPVIRGIIETATTRRKEFERQQRGAAGGGKVRPKRPSFEEILRGEPGPGAGRGAEAFDDEDGSASVETPPARRVPAPPPLPPARPRVTAPSAPAAGRDAANTGWGTPKKRAVSLGPELVGDPFDESQMGRDLVDNSSLAEVPTENKLEERFDENAAARKLRAQGDARAQARRRAANTPDAAPGAAALARIEGRLSPWQRAFVLKELLGPPRSVAPHRDRR